MTPDVLESLLQGARETDAVEFKQAMDWDRNTFVKDILAMANIIDGGTIIVGVEDQTFARQGMTDDQIATYDPDTMRDQIAPFADPRVVFEREVVTDAQELRFVVIEVSPFEKIPVICARGGNDVRRGEIYFRSRARRPSSARVERSEDMREIVETSIVRRSRALRRIGYVVEGEEAAPAAADNAAAAALDDELGGL